MHRTRHHQTFRAALMLAVALALFVRGSRAVETAAPAGNPEFGPAFVAAVRAFEDGFFERAATQFAELYEVSPAGPLRSQARMLQVQSLYKLGRYREAAERIEKDLEGAEQGLDDLRFWLAEARFANGEPKEAAAQYRLVLTQHPASTRVPQAALGLAHALFQQGQAREAVAWLSGPEYTALLKGSPDFGARSRLLLGEALLVLNRTAQAARVVADMESDALGPQASWRRSHLRTRLLIKEDQLESALQESGALIVLAEGAAGSSFLAESLALQGELLERLGRPGEAEIVYRRLLQVPSDAGRRRTTYLKLVELLRAGNRLPDAIAQMEAYLREFAPLKEEFEARLVLGELFFKAHLVTPDASGGAYLEQALEQFDLLLREFPEHPGHWRVRLNQGRCHWEAGQLEAAKAAFTEAVRGLPPGKEQAEALFRLADTQARLGDSSAALGGYQKVLADYAGFERIRTSFFPRALGRLVYQAASLDDLSVATNALLRLQTEYPHADITSRAMLQVAELKTELGRPAEARALISKLRTEEVADSLDAEAAFAKARSHIRELDWDAALLVYQNWIESHPDDPLLARAEFDLAWLQYRSGRQDQGLSGLTNFMARHSGHERAGLARYLVADHQFKQGQFDLAERNFAVLFDRREGERVLKFESGLMAARCALARQGYASSRGYFTNLILNAEAPPTVVARAWYGLGDVIIEDAEAYKEQPLKRFEYALLAFEKVPQLFSTNRLAPLAWGRIGHCHLQLAAQNPGRYPRALEAYQQAESSPLSSVTTRSEAKVAMGFVQESLATGLPKAGRDQAIEAALNHYLDVLYEKVLRKGERSDLYWVNKAGLAAGRLLEGEDRKADALKVYSRLLLVLPRAYHGPLERKIRELSPATVSESP